ncbi:unnamed protein product [Didymodactylos carnosus]|uniref:Uncharacterized protein n=1 Tax=Didymodactylos carnosus TaxID=1234261 RepID=A0A815SVE4_9BILA|nr:unnamed protein product [Didymodactylos carnosus]CAF1495841.1 unnamed protein product [Didymodactylos carnosus]CAF4222295.1 unnamed protein product [Didymodactylos carnosus]CAF4358302.1 unnamed protein product [Didymodactylos carnosus]
MGYYHRPPVFKRLLLLTSNLNELSVGYDTLSSETNDFEDAELRSICQRINRLILTDNQRRWALQAHHKVYLKYFTKYA